MRVSNDDAIWRYQPRLIDLRGWTVVGQPRYVVLAVVAVTATVLVVPFLVLFDTVLAVLLTLATAGLAGYFLSPYLTAERPLVAWAAGVEGEVRAARHWWRCRRSARRDGPRTYAMPARTTRARRRRSPPAGPPGGRR